MSGACSASSAIIGENIGSSSSKYSRAAGTSGSPCVIASSGLISSTPQYSPLCVGSASKLAAAVRADNESELSRLDDQITTLRRKHDELAHANMEKRRDLEKLTDRLQDLSKEAQLPSANDSSIVKEIRALEASLTAGASQADAADAPPASPRVKLADAQALDASLNPPTAP